MIKNYFKQAFKSVIGQGHQSVISALGLSVALSCNFLILIYVQYEISYDKFHKDALVSNIPGVENSTKCRLYSHTLEKVTIKVALPLPITF